MQRKLLLFIVILISSFTYSQNLYWVGGSGNLTDGNHWSYTSGGTPSGISPTLQSNLIFDNNSSGNTFVVNLVGMNYAKSLICNNTEKELHFTGDNFSNLKCEGDFVLNEKTFYEANSKLIFSNSNSNYPTVNFWKNSPNADVLFEDGNWSLQSLKVSDNNLLKFNKGNYKAINVSIIAGNLESNSDNVVFHADHSNIYVKNRITLGNKVSFNSNNLILIAQKNNPALYHVNSNIDFGTNSKILETNPTTQACSITYSFTNPSCAGQCDGTISIGFAAGCTTGPYDLIFTNGSGCFPAGANGVSPPTYTLGSLCSCSGQLDIIVTDAGGFVTILPGQSTPQDPNAVSLTFSGLKQPRCFGLCDGSINIFASSGSPPYTIAVVTPTGTAQTFTNVPPVTTTTVSNLCAGTYSFVVTDSKGCAKTFVTTMTQPPQLFANVTPVNINCFASCNGSASSAPSGGVGPYTYSWISSVSTPSSSSTSSIGNLCPGVVTMTVTDSKTCTATYSTTITQPPIITLSVIKTNLVCSTICNGTASITATGGSGVGYTYTWTPMGSGNFSNNLCAGAYTVDVADSFGCLKQITFTLTAPPTLTATSTQTNVLCNSANTGAINLNPSGGTPGYTYTWVPLVSNTLTATGLVAGVYSFTITDTQACPFSSTITITEPPAISLSVTQTSVTCPGACNGTAIANLSGGTPPYTYTWTPGGAPLVGQGTASVTGLCAGNYTLTIKDFNNCSKTSIFVITQPPPILPNVTTVAPTCFSLCNGSINSAPSGGNGGPYTFTLTPSVGAPVIGTPPYSGLCAGSYTLTIGDNGCIKTQTIILTQPNLLTLTLNATAINCFNQCNSTISSVIGGGTPGYVVTWGSGPSPGPSQINQCAGIHTATVTDSKGCQQTASVNIVAPPDMTVTITPTQPNCNGMCTGVATATVSGGTPNYGIVWSTGASGNTISNLCQGNYTATVTDNKGCVKTQPVAIIAPPALTLTPTNGTVSCSGGCDGTVSVVATGGTPGYFYNWNSVPAQTAPTATALCVGNYNVSVTDSKGCLLTSAANVTQPPVLTVSISNVKPSCNICIGEATAAGIGGTAPYTYSWSPGGQTIANPTDLCVGPQTVTVTDSKGCVATQTVQINETIILVITSNGATLACNGVCSGIAAANGVGGVLPYIYSWNSPPVAPTQTTQTASNLCVGTHTVIVTDQQGCSSSGTVTFAQPPAITLTVTKADVKCNSACNGSVSVTGSGGTGAISYQWQPGGSTSPSLTGLCAGDYTLTATDANGCTQTTVVTIAQPSSLTVTYSNTNPSTCVSNDGAVSFTVTGGTAPINSTWIVPAAGGTVNPLTNLTDGSYVLSVTDANGCIQSFTTSLSDPLGPTVTVTSNSVACFGSCTGSATLSITGNGPFTVNWPAIPSTNTIVTNLCAGNYVASVTDNNSCVTNQTLNIAQPTQITSSGIVSNVTCNSVCSGSINLTVNGGTPVYSYTWLPTGGNGQDPTGLCANNYSVTIGDANNCTVTNTYVVTQPSTLTLSFNKKDVLCNGGCTGGVRAVVAGGTAPYSYTWTPVGAFVGSNIDTIVNLCTGVYTVNATDANGCIISGTVSIGQPTALTSTITSTNIKCNGQCNGSAIINPAGGTIPYGYSFNTSPSTPTQSVGGLCVGTYSGTVTDANGCVSSNSFVITQPLPIVITTTVTNPKCNAACDGSVTTTVTGGNPNYSYSWIPAGAPLPNPTGLCAGNYTVTVTDDSLCTAQALVTLVNPPTLVANITFTNPTCNGGCNGIVSASGVGGTSPYTYSWVTPAVVNTPTVGSLCAGNYTITITDVNLCQLTQTTTLVNLPSITVNPAVTPANCGINDGSINAVAVGGTPNYTYNWLPPVPAAQATITLVTNLGAGVYTVIVTDAAACSATVSIPLSNSNGPTDIVITSTNIACNGQANGGANILGAVGGTAPYTLTWATPSTTNTSISGLSVGDYTAQVVDVNGCIYFESITITEPQLIDDNENITSALCFGNCNGSIGLNPTGGNGGYTYVWSNAATTQTVSGLCPGNYSVTITDVLGCTLTANYNLPSIISITSSTFATNNICFTDCNGTLLATTVAGGTPPYSFNWSDPLGQSTAQAIGLCTGPYSVTITDAVGCLNVIPAAITAPSLVTFTPTITQPSCDMCNGVAVVNPIGGTPTYTLVWSNLQTGTTATNLCAGVYMVQITDGNGCLSNSNVVINSSSGITGEVITQADESCASACDGTVTVTAVGGVAPITYHWVHDNSTLQTLSGLCAGTYFCNMTDANGCGRTASVVIGAAVTLSVTSHVTQSSCTASTGSVVVNVSGGTGVYTYAWLPASVVSTTNTATNLAPGSYTLMVTDGNGCSQTHVYSMGTINGPVITYKENDITCAPICNGSIDIVINSGTPAFTAAWSNGASGLSVNGLCAGPYSVLVTDNAGCTAVQNFSISSPVPIIFSSPDLDSPACHDDCNGSLTALPVGGSLPYTFSWTPTSVTAPTTNSLCAGNYSITITDANGCIAVDSYTLINPPTMTLTAVITDASCNTIPDGGILVTNGGGVPAYTYSWIPSSITTPTLTNVLSGTYTLTITDNNGNGCTLDTALMINATVVVNAIAGNDTTFCQNGTLNLDGSNSNGGVTYQWSEFPLGTVISNTLIATISPATGTSTYVLVATNGACVDSDTILVTSNALPNVDAGPMVSIPLLTTSPIGGNPTGPGGSTFTWTPNTALDNPSGTNPTTSTTITTIYTVSVTDANGCMNSDTVTVYVYPEIKIPNGFSPNSDGKNDTWMIDFINQFPECEVEVYNRWGEQLFYSKGYPIPWNGQYKSKELPVGTYYYIINLNNPSYPDAYTGPLTIFR